MKKQGKRYKAIKNQIPEEKQEISNALKICKETANAKFDESIDVVFSLNLDTKDPEQNIRTTVSLPNGTGKVLLDGDGSSGGVAVTDGLVEIKTGTGSVAKVKFYCESSNAHAQTLQAAPHSAASSAVLTLPTNTGTLIGTGDSGTLPLGAIDIDGGTDIGADLTTSDLIVVDDGAGGTNRKAALSRVVTLMTNQGFTTDDPTALAIALG